MATPNGSDNEDKERNKVATLDIDLNEFDDREFDIPILDNPPSLESILNAPDDLDVSISADASTTLVQNNDLSETASVCSFDGVSSGGSQSSRVDALSHRGNARKSIRYEEHGSVLRHVVLKGIAAQMSSAADRVDAGLPTALAVSSLIAVGTSHGLVLVFDPKQVLKWCLGGATVGTQFGAVSALSFNIDCTRLLCGFARGQITMWDLTNGKLLRTITDAHPPGTAILHVKFTDDRTVAVTSDSGGSVFMLEFKRLIGVRTCESQCLFSGSRGEVCVIEPLNMQRSLQADHPMKDIMMVAMASLSKVLIVVIKPQLKVQYIHPLPGAADTLPLLAWQFVIIQVSDADRVIDPVLAFGRDETIFFVQVQYRGSNNGVNDISVVPLQKMETLYKLLSISWLNSRTMVAIDTSERCHLFDVKTEEELEVIDLADVQLAYSTSFYKSLATGGNVSKALAYAGERACYQSIVVSSGQLVLLGTKALHVLTLRSWSDRLSLLERKDMYTDALNLAQTFYDGKAKAVVGMVGGATRRKQIVGEMIMSLLDRYVSVAMTRLSPAHGKVSELEAFYSLVVTTCVDHCLHIGRTDALFSRIYERFAVDAIVRATFLESLEPYILSDSLTSVTPSIMKDFVTHYEEKGMVERVEACIVHMDIASLDLHQVISLCWAHGLYDAIIYIYTRGMSDYTSPLEELISRLSAYVSTGKPLTYTETQLGNKILVYTSCCLTGRAYPLGDIPDADVARVKDDITRCLTALHTSSHTTNESVEPAYPRLRTLIHFDTREFFNVLALAFDDPEFVIEKRQRYVDILIQLMVNSVNFTPLQVSVLFTFLARQIARDVNQSLVVERGLFDQVIESLCSADGGTDGGAAGRHEERQQALLELLKAGGSAAGGQGSEETRVVSLAERAGFYRVCEMLHERRRRFSLIPACYWNDSARSHQIFAYIHKILSDSSGLTVQERKEVCEALRAGLPQLVQIDARRTAKLFTVTLHISPSDILRGQADGSVSDNSAYEFLRGVFELKKIELGQSDIFDFTDDSIMEDHFGNSQPSNSKSKNSTNNVEAEVFEKYIELMLSRVSAERVELFLKATDGYRINEVLTLCRRYRGMEKPIAFLLEKSGDIQGAFNILCSLLSSSLNALLASVERVSVDGSEVGQCAEKQEQVKSNLAALILLCRRHCHKLEVTNRETMWFEVLDTVLSSQQKFRSSQSGQSTSNTGTGMSGVAASSSSSSSLTSGTDVGMTAGSKRISVGDVVDVGVVARTSVEEDLKVLTRQVIDAMMSDIPLPRVLAKIISAPAYSSGKLGEMKDLLVGMLDTYRYETTLLTTCASLVSHDLHGQLATLTAASRRAVSLKSYTCFVCAKVLDYGVSGSDVREVVCFQCGHGYHVTCLVEAGDDRAGVRTGSQRLTCTVCYNKARQTRILERTGVRYGAGTRVHNTESSSGARPKAQSIPIDGTREGLNSAQIQAIENLRQATKSQSRFAILSELSELDRLQVSGASSRGPRSGTLHSGRDVRAGNSLLQNEDFTLKLTARPPPRDT